MSEYKKIQNRLDEMSTQLNHLGQVVTQLNLFISENMVTSKTFITEIEKLDKRISTETEKLIKHIDEVHSVVKGIQEALKRRPS